MLRKKNWDSMTSQELSKVVNYWECLRGCRVSWTKNAVHLIGIPKELFMAITIDQKALDEYKKNDAERLEKICKALHEGGYSNSEISDFLDARYSDVDSILESEKDE